MSCFFIIYDLFMIYFWHFFLYCDRTVFRQEVGERGGRDSNSGHPKHNGATYFSIEYEADL